MPYQQPRWYIERRQNYSYDAPDVLCAIQETHGLSARRIVGIFSNIPPITHSNAVSLREFEVVVQAVFRDCFDARTVTPIHVENLKQIAGSIVYWKNYSQGGRGPRKRENVFNRWNDCTYNQLMMAFEAQSIADFRIGGVRIPTASAFMRFLYPSTRGVVDSRVVNNHTNPAGITNFNVRHDGYINDVTHNIEEYNQHYSSFLQTEADWLNEQGTLFFDPVIGGTTQFRACDIEMALW